MEDSIKIIKESGIVIFEIEGDLDETNAQSTFEKIYNEI
jgi:anti-anti-sigma regulatory factor